jgi:hypothetical protein
MMIYLTRFDGQHKQCLVCSGILEAKCTLIGYAVDCTIEKTREREREGEISDRIERERENK